MPSFHLLFEIEPDGTYTMISDICKRKKRKDDVQEHLFNFDLFYFAPECSDVISNNPGKMFEITGNQLNKLKRSISIINNFSDQLNQCSWGEKRVRIYQHLDIQRQKLLKVLGEVLGEPQ